MVTTVFAKATTVLPTPGTLSKASTSDTITTTSVVPVAGGLGQNDTNVALIPGVVVGVVLAVVLVVVVVAIVMAVCLVQWKRKNYDHDSKGSHEVPLGSYIGRFTKHIGTVYNVYCVFCYIVSTFMLYCYADYSNSYA